MRSVVEQFREEKLYAKIKKCEFGKPNVKYLITVTGLGKL